MRTRNLAALVAAATFAAPTLASEVETLDDAVDSEASSEPAEPEEPRATAASGYIARSAVTTNVVAREPQDSVSELTNDHTQVFYFTELRDLEGETVRHRWEFEGAVMAEVPFDVGGPRWRVHSSKSLLPEWLGAWTVSVVDSGGRILASESFAYKEAAAEPASPAQGEEMAPVGEAPPAAEPASPAQSEEMAPAGEAPPAAAQP